MRATFIGTLADLADQDRRIVLLTGDIGYTILEPFAERHPDRFYNMGVAEQNMVGVATGLAEAGFIPFVYSIATFAVLRPYEFIRNGPILHRLPVRIVGVGGGFEYGAAGPTHHALEDVGVMRLQPGISVVAPCDHQQARSALLATWEMEGPVYYRLGKDESTTVPGLDGRFQLGRAQVVREGADLLVVAMGSMAATVAAAVDILAQRGVSCALMVVASVSPSPREDLMRELARFPLVVTVEAHYANGGVGSLVAEAIAESGLCCRLRRCAVRHSPDGATGGEKYLHDLHGLSPSGLVASILEFVDGSDRGE